MFLNGSSDEFLAFVKDGGKLDVCGACFCSYFFDELLKFVDIVFEDVFVVCYCVEVLDYFMCGRSPSSLKSLLQFSSFLFVDGVSFGFSGFYEFMNGYA